MNNIKTISFKRMLFKLKLVDGPRCDRYKQASETASHLYDCEPLAVLGFRRVAHHFMKPRDFADFSISKVMHFVQSAGLLSANAKGCTKDQELSRNKGECGARPDVLYSTLFAYCFLSVQCQLRLEIQ